MTLRYEEALEFAIKAHAGQKRWDGTSYINHPIRVAEYFSDDSLKTAAVLHDVVEDTEITLDEIDDKFGGFISMIVDSVTRRDNETYKEFIKRTSKNSLGSIIKIADIKDNIKDVPNDKGMKKKARSLYTQRYLPALIQLKEALAKPSTDMLLTCIMNDGDK